MDFTQIQILISGLIISTVIGSTPLIFASMGGLFSERSGVVQIALEGMMLFGALSGAIAAFLFHSAWLGLVGAVLGSMLMALIYAFFVLALKSDQIISGTALNILAFGIAPLITKTVFSSTGSTPSLDLSSRFFTAPVVLAALVVLLVHYLFYFTKVGLDLRFAGEEPEVLSTTGVSVIKVRFFSLMACGVLTGMGGASLSLFLASSYSPAMTAGRGFIALAALIFGKWKPLPTVMACLFFAFIEAVQIRIQGVLTFIPGQFIQVLPYLVTILVIAGFFGKSQAPKALGRAE